MEGETEYPNRDHFNPGSINRYHLFLILWALLIGFCILELLYIPFFGAESRGIPIPRWQMAPPDLICHILYSISPSVANLGQIILLYGGAGFGIYLGFRTISEKNVLNNAKRQYILNFIQEHPGINFNALRYRTNINRGTLRYHLSILSRTKKITCIRNGIFSRYFPVEITLSEYNRVIACRFQNVSDQKIISYLFSHPYVSQREIAGAVGLSPSFISGRMKLLKQEGIIEMERLGRATQIILSNETIDFLRRINSTNVHTGDYNMTTSEISG